MNSSAYTSDQISEYLSFIQLPASYHPSLSTNLPPLPLDLAYLTTLHVHQISTIPYENLSLHYSRHRQIDLDPQVLFDKFLRRRRGGYCLETSLFFNHVLRALGFQVYTAPVRIRLRKDAVPFGNFDGLRHIVNIVSLPDSTSPTGVTKYMVDVGFGGDGATKPLPLIHNKPQHNLGTQSIRLMHDTITEQIDQSDTQKLWQYQYRNKDDQEWNTYYAFPEFEMLPVEWDTLNFWLTNHPDSFQRWIVLAIKFLRSNDNKNTVEITGKVMLADNKLKRNLGGRTELMAEFQSEAERVDALRKWFGLNLGEDEIDAIRGHRTALDCGLNDTIQVRVQDQDQDQDQDRNNDNHQKTVVDDGGSSGIIAKKA